MFLKCLSEAKLTSRNKDGELEMAGNPVINGKRGMLHQAGESRLIGWGVDPLKTMQGQAVIAAAAALILPEKPVNDAKIDRAGRPFCGKAGRGLLNMPR